MEVLKDKDCTINTPVVLGVQDGAVKPDLDTDYHDEDEEALELPEESEEDDGSEDDDTDVNEDYEAETDDEPDEICLNAAKTLGNYIGKNRHTLVFGGFGDGLLGAVADEAWRNGAEVISVLPEVPRKGHSEFLHSAKVFRDSDKRMRKKLQAENSDAFVIMPEGLGVLDELFEVLLLKQYGEHNKPIYIVNIEHKYDLLISLLKEQNCEALFTVISEVEFQNI